MKEVHQSLFFLNICPHLAVLHRYMDLGVRGSVIFLEIWNFEIVGDIDVTDYAKLRWVYSSLCSFKAIQAVHDSLNISVQFVGSRKSVAR